MKVLDGHEHGLAADVGELERGERAARPAAERDRGQAVVGAPRLLERMR